jgi:hypothetical protein
MTDPDRAASPINRLLGDGGSCRRLFDDVAVHWYPQGSKPGDQCWCGERTMPEPEEDEDVR